MRYAQYAVREMRVNLLFTTWPYCVVVCNVCIISIILYLSLQAASKSYSTAGIASWTSSGCVRCLICRFLRELLLNSNNKSSSFAIFLSWVEIWVEKSATQILSRLKSSCVAFWVSCNGFYIEPTQIGELSRLNCWVAFIQSALRYFAAKRQRNNYIWLFLNWPYFLENHWRLLQRVFPDRMSFLSSTASRQWRKRHRKNSEIIKQTKDSEDDHEKDIRKCQNMKIWSFFFLFFHHTLHSALQRLTEL